ncbi:MAG: rubredoxin [Pseudomonadota bacterium]|jgi:rubredoxin|nr:rubredoxin [Pseudomonadota bacterium]
MEYKTWMCVICGFVYDEEQGLPEEGLVPGTRWEDIPDNWQCPDCDATKSDFEMIEI